MNILRKTIGFLTAVAMAAGMAVPVGVTADSAAAEEVTDNISAPAETPEIAEEKSEDEGFGLTGAEEDGSELTASEDDEQYAEEYAKLHNDPQYGKYMKAKALSESVGEDDYAPLSTLGGAEGGSGLVALDKYSNNKLVHNSRFDGMDTVWGIDVSYFQYDIDWDKVANDVDYAIIRVGYRGYAAEGELVLDYKFKENIKEAKAAGLEVGVYFYTQAITSDEAREEADFVYKYIKNYDLELPVYFDIESVDWDSGRLDEADLTVAQKTQICKAFCNRMKKYGYEAGVYANMNWLCNMIDGEELGEKYPIWLAHYTTQTDYEGEYQTWQFSSTGKVSGISTNVDMDVNYRVPTSRVVYPQPGNFRMSVSNGVATFTCDEMDEVNKYQLFSVDESDGTYTKLGVSTEPVITAELTDKYTGYVMRGVDTTGEILFFSQYTDAIYAQKGMPANFTVEDAIGGAVKVSWDKLDEAEGYMVYRAKGYGSSFVKYRSLGANSCSIRETTLSANSCYGYKVVPVINGTEGVSTKEKWYITEVSKVSNLKTVSAASDRIVLKWNGVSGVSGYEIALYNAATGKYTKKAIVTDGVNGVVTSLSPKTQYKFAVRAYTEAGGAKRYGEYSDILTASTILSAPAKLYATGSSSGVKLTWKKATGAVSYRVYKKIDGKFKRIATDLTGLSYTDKTAPSARTVYTVKAVYNVNGKLQISGSSRNCAVNAVPYQTSAYTVRTTASRIRIGWNAVSNCTGYKVYMFNYDTGKYTVVKTIKSKSTVTYVATGLSANTKCKFKVRPYKKGVNGICWGKYTSPLVVRTSAY